MPEAVIVSAARSPIGRANKGSLKDFRPDDLSALDHPGRAGQDPGARPAHDRRPLPRLRPARRRVAATTWRASSTCSSGYDGPGRHDHPLLLLVGADHADGLPRDQGRRGRRLRLRRRRDGLPLRQGHLRPHARHPQPALRRTPSARHRRSYAAGRPGLARPARGRRSSPTSTSRWARPPRTSPGCAGSTARSSTSSASASQNLAEKAIADGFWAARDHPGHDARRHRRSARTTARAPG